MGLPCPSLLVPCLPPCSPASLQKPLPSDLTPRGVPGLGLTAAQVGGHGTGAGQLAGVGAESSWLPTGSITTSHSSILQGNPTGFFSTQNQHTGSQLSTSRLCFHLLASGSSWTRGKGPALNCCKA